MENESTVSKLLNHIQHTERNIVESTFFDIQTRLVLLSFIGASDYFITEFGLIWDRSKTYLDYRDKLTKYYQPWVFRDPYFPYPWVYLKTSIGPQWYPINQLLGWAYRPDTETDHYFLLKEPTLFPHKLDDYHWTSRPPENERSVYLSWMKDQGL